MNRRSIVVITGFVTIAGLVCAAAPTGPSSSVLEGLRSPDRIERLKASAAVGKARERIISGLIAIIAESPPVEDDSAIESPRPPG